MAKDTRQLEDHCIFLGQKAVNLIEDLVQYNSRYVVAVLPVECLGQVLEVELSVEVASAVEGLEAALGLLGGDSQDGRDRELRDEARAEVDVRQRHDRLVQRRVDRHLQIMENSYECG